MYFDAEDNTKDYYYWHKRAKEFEKMRKAKKKKAEKRKKKLEREKATLLRKTQRAEAKIKFREEKKQKKIELLEQLKKVGYKRLYTVKNPLKRHKRSRNLDLCKEIYEKSKNGVSTFTLAKEYDLHPNTILRHKYEYQYYLGIKGLDIEINL